MIMAVNTDPQSRIKGLGFGADAVVAKPIDEAELVSQIKVALRIKKAEDSLREERDSLERILEERTTALRNSEIRYRRITEAITDYIYSVRIEDQKAIETRHGAGCQAVTGYSEEEFTADPCLWLSMVEVEDRPAVIAQASRVLAGERTSPIEHRIVRKDGVQRWVRNTPVPRHNPQGRLQAYDGLIQDITERKAIEEEQRRNQAAAERLAGELAIIAEIGRLISSTLDIDEVYECFAAEARKLIPFDRLVVYLNKHQEGTQHCVHVSGMDIPDRRQGDSFLLAGSMSEVLVRTRTGLIVHYASVEETAGQYPTLVSTFQAGLCSMMGVPLIYRDEVIGALQFRSKKPNAYTEQNLRLAERIGAQIAGAIASAKLFTDLDKAEKTLRESEARYRHIVEMADEGIWEINDVSQTTFVNRKLSEMLGYRPDEMLDRPDTDFMFEEDHPDQQAFMKQRAAGLGGQYEKRLRRKDGTACWTLVSATPLQDETGQFSGAFGMFTDITESKRMEEERLNLEERLHRAEKMEALGKLAGGVAHDLNNVLGVVVGYSELLTLKIPEDNPARGYADKILKSTTKGAAIIQDLLTLARRGVVVSDVINLNHVVTNFLKTPVFDHLKDYHPQVEFRTDLDNNLLNIKGSLLHLEKTVMNLVSNAAEAISGRGEVIIRTENRYLDRPIHGYDRVRVGEYAVLTISDNGKGIEAADMEKIFLPFYTKKVMGRSGTGLGLAVVWGTVQDYNGYIDVQSELGKGSTFTLYFSISREKLMEDLQKIAREEYLGRGQSILVVDDVADQRDMAATVLTGLGYQVETVSSGEAAVEHAKKNKIDLLVLDMIMEPGIDGLETYERILKINPKQKAIIVSGFSETDRVKKGLELGVGAYVKKPYVLEKIGVVVRDVLSR
jgi:PAS domain S-box-containing protein